MPLGLAIGAGATAAGKFALPFISKHLLTLLIGGGILGGQALGAYGQAGERKLARGQMELQAKLAGTSAEAGKRATKESRARTEEYTKQLMKLRKEEKRESQDVAAMESFTASQDRQMALVLQAIQSMSQPSRAPSMGGGMVSLMRGGF